MENMEKKISFVWKMWRKNYVSYGKCGEKIKLLVTVEPCYEKPCFLHTIYVKQMRGNSWSASLFSLHRYTPISTLDGSKVRQVYDVALER